MKKQTSQMQEQGKETGALVPSLEARVRPHSQVTGGRELLGFADLIIAGAFVIKDVSILRTKGKDEKEFGEPFVAFPSKKGNGNAEGKYFDIAHPITADAYKAAVETIMAAYALATEAAQPA